MNFAYGGTGVFDTLTVAPNMTTQIDIFEKLIKDSVYTKKDVESSLFLVSVSGNDYAYYVNNGGTFAVRTYITLPYIICSYVGEVIYS